MGVRRSFWRFGGNYWRLALCAASEDGAVDEEYGYCAEDSDGEAAQAEPGDERLVREEAVEVAADEGSGHAEEHRDDASAGVASRHEELGDDPRE